MSSHLVIGPLRARLHDCHPSLPLSPLVALMAFTASSPAIALGVADYSIDGAAAWRENRARCDDDDDIVVSARLEDVEVDAVLVQYVLVSGARCPADGDGGTAIGAPSRHVPVDSGVELRSALSRDELLGTGACGGKLDVGRRFEGVLCLQVRDEVDATLLATQAVDVAFDTAVPLPPAVADLSGDDDTITATVETDPDEPWTLRVEHRRCTGDAVIIDNADGEDDASSCGARGAFLVEEGPAPTVAVAGLAPRSTWEVRLRVVDDFDNVSAPTEVMRVTLRDSLGLVDLLEPTPPASCASASAVPAWGISALLPLWLCRSTTGRRWRRRRRWTGGAGLALLGAVLTLAPSSTRAQNATTSSDGRWTASLAVGLHHPDVDGASRLPVWKCLYGDASLVPVSGDVGVHLYDGFGSLQLSLGVMGAQARGLAASSSSSSSSVGCPASTSLPLQFAMLGGRAGLTWRLDQLLDTWEIPVVPYARVGGVALGYMLSKRSVVEHRNERTGLDGAGLRLGVEAAGGVMLALDLLDRAAAKRARAYSGLAHGFVFIEAAAQELGLQGLPLDLTPVDRALRTGLPLSFRVGLAVELL